QPVKPAPMSRSVKASLKRTHSQSSASFAMVEVPVENASAPASLRSLKRAKCDPKIEIDPEDNPWDPMVGSSNSVFTTPASVISTISKGASRASSRFTISSSNTPATSVFGDTENFQGECESDFDGSVLSEISLDAEDEGDSVELTGENASTIIASWSS